MFTQQVELMARAKKKILTQAPYVTLRHVAAAVGVHVSTVSLALRRHLSIPKNTRAKIEAKARELGYRPDPMLRSLHMYSAQARGSRQAATIALVVQHESLTAWRRHYAGRSYFEGMERRARELGFELESYCAPELQREGKNLDAILRARGIRAVMLAPAPISSVGPALDWAHYAAVTVGYANMVPRLHRVVPHYRFAVKTALTELRALGYKRFAFAYHPEDEKRTQHGWSSGYLMEREMALSGEDFSIYSRKFSGDVAGYLKEVPEFKRWFLRCRPEVILSTGDWVPAMLDEELKLKLPDDVGYVHLARPPGERRYSGIDQRLDGVGAAAIDMLGAMVHQNEYGLPEMPKIVVMEGQWAAGRTVRGAKRRE
jgi:LacI family transcriptional regulator